MKKHKPTQEYLDLEIFNALMSRKEVKLFLCKDEESGFGVKINGKEVCRNMAWEVFEYKFSELDAI